MEFKNHILNALQSIEIDASQLNEEDKLGDGVGMDSREMAELVFTLEKNLDTKLPDNFFDKQMTLKEASAKLSAHMEFVRNS